jgi:hypothetical protein
MFGQGHRFDEIERLLKNEICKKDRRIEQLERALADAQTWTKKWREKARFLRRARRRLAEEQKLHEEMPS